MADTRILFVLGVGETGSRGPRPVAWGFFGSQL